MNENELTSNERSKRLQERQAIELAEDAKGGGGSWLRYYGRTRTKESGNGCGNKKKKIMRRGSPKRGQMSRIAKIWTTRREKHVGWKMKMALLFVVTLNGKNAKNEETKQFLIH